MIIVKYKTYNELIVLAAECRLEHRNLTDKELTRLVLLAFKINRSILRDIDGVTDNMNFRNNGA